MYKTAPYRSVFFQDLMDEAYLPLVSGALMQTQVPATAAYIVRDVFLRVVNSQSSQWTPVRLFMEMLNSTFRVLMKKSEESILSPQASPVASPGSYNSKIQSGRGNIYDTGKILLNHHSHDTNTIESWLLYPLFQEEPDRYKRGIKAGLLCWLSDIKSDEFTVALLADWFNYDPTHPDARLILDEIAYLTSMSPDRVYHTWRTGQDDWVRFFTASGPSLLEALRIWLECIDLSEEDFLKNYLVSHTRPAEVHVGGELGV